MTDWTLEMIEEVENLMLIHHTDRLLMQILF